MNTLWSCLLAVTFFLPFGFGSTAPVPAGPGCCAGCPVGGCEVCPPDCCDDCDDCCAAGAPPAPAAEACCGTGSCCPR